LQALTGERRIRETLLETLSARAVRVDASQLEALVRRLAYRDLYPRLDLPPAAAETPAELSAEERITLAAALAVYATLADRLSADVRPPHTLASQWRQRLTDAERDAVDRQVERLLAALRRATPGPAEDHLPVPTGETLTALEQAIAEDATVEIRYYTAGRDHVTQRHVDPLRLEWRGDVAYVIAYCHLRQAQRVFRVERIEALTPLKG
jgi:predicted DNA-binding transcriptional regulator YafY